MNRTTKLFRRRIGYRAPRGQLDAPWLCLKPQALGDDDVYT
jgi:hypothetical protein